MLIMVRKSDASSHLISGLFLARGSVEMRTSAFSAGKLRSLLDGAPAVMVLAGPGHEGGADRLLRLLGAQSELSRTLPASSKDAGEWVLLTADEAVPIGNDREVMTILQEAATREADVRVVVRSRTDATARFDRFLRHLQSELGIANLSIAERAPGEASARSSDREALIQVRKEMLAQVGGTLSSEDLAMAARSVTTNSSQLAADQRRRGSLFGVRWGREWHYPLFQFDASRRSYPEIREVLAALSPDTQGWDRLQWFLQPHERLKGRTPLQVWTTDRKEVIGAANTERWDGRD